MSPARKALGRLGERLLFQPRLSTDEGELYLPRHVQRVSAWANRRFVERGSTPPWMWSAERCRAFWASRTQDAADPNHPTTYSSKDPAIVAALDEFWAPEVQPGAVLLEVGPNAGANLAALHRRGHTGLGGVEINPGAVEEMRRAFPEVAAVARITSGPLEDVLPSLEAGSADVVFSMAVLLHVHPSSDEVFAEMVRVAGQHVCVVEAEHVSATYVFPRDYGRLFETLGCTQVREQTLTRRTHPDVGPEYWGYTMRLFAVPG